MFVDKTQFLDHSGKDFTILVVRGHPESLCDLFMGDDIILIQRETPIC